MRIAVFSDVHGNAGAMEAVLKLLKKQVPDMTVFLGDLVMNGPHPQEVFQMMRCLKPDVWLKGNTDAWIDEISGGFVPSNEMEKHILLLFGYAKDRLFNEQTDFIRALPEKRTICCAGKRILCAHGSPRRINEPVGPMSSEEELEAMTEDMPADVLLCGHTHRPFETCVNGKMIINAGGVSLCAEPSMGILEIEGGAIRFIPLPVEYDVAAMLRDAAAKGFPGGDGYAAKFGCEM